MKAKCYYKDGTIFEGDYYDSPHYHEDSSKILHREDGPAIESANGDKEWFLNGKYHRENGPAVESAHGNKYWYLNGKRHKEDGPAIEWANGTRQWCLNGKCHREDGPAMEWANGDRAWFLNGMRHREDGPALEYVDGIKYWFLNDEELEILSQEYLIRYMELTGETLVTLLLHPEKIVRDSVKKYKWDNIS